MFKLALQLAIARYGGNYIPVFPALLRAIRANNGYCGVCGIGQGGRSVGPQTKGLSAGNPGPKRQKVRTG